MNDETWTDNRKAAVANATNAQTNVNQVMQAIAEASGSDEIFAGQITAHAQVMALTAQVFATLDLADAIREANR